MFGELAVWAVIFGAIILLAVASVIAILGICLLIYLATDKDVLTWWFVKTNAIEEE